MNRWDSWNDDEDITLQEVRGFACSTSLAINEVTVWRFVVWQVYIFSKLLMLSSTNYLQDIWSEEVALEYLVSLVIKTKKHASIVINEVTFWNSVVIEVQVLSIFQILFLYNYLQLIWSGKVERDCFGSLECQDEKDNGLTKRIILSCMLVMITIL